MVTLTRDALDHHNQRQDNPIKRVKVRLMSGDQVGWYSLGEKPETVLTFPGAFTVGEILHDQYEMWVRKAKDGDNWNETLTRTFPDGQKIEFVRVGDIKALILDSHWVSGHEQKIGTLNQTEILGVITEAEIPLQRANTDANLIDLNDIQPVSISTSVFSDWVSSAPGTRLLVVSSPPSSLASGDWFPDESMADDDEFIEAWMGLQVTNEISDQGDAQPEASG